MTGKIVLGCGFGDEGKGVATDFLSTNILGGVVIRFSGGQQAGHTVVIGDKRHTYSTFGSGTGRGLPTYLSEYCTFYPPNALNEHSQLIDKGFKPLLYVHPLAKLTTYWDVAWGRLRERIYNHGSCGIGVGATMMRHEHTPCKIFANDLKTSTVLKAKLHQANVYYMDKLKELEIEEEMKTYFVLQAEAEKGRFFDSLNSDFIKELVSGGIRPPSFLFGFRNFIFEGSQGILLDMEHGVYPNVTYAYTTSKNALSICKELGISDVEVYYVTRCYLTRHGQCWWKHDNSIKLVNNENEHNRYNQWQGHFKVGELDYELLKHAINADNAYSWGHPKNLIVTCLDQRPDFQFDYSQIPVTLRYIYESRSPDSYFIKNLTEERASEWVH